jgi:hypothetical protein
VEKPFHGKTFAISAVTKSLSFFNIRNPVTPSLMEWNVHSTSCTDDQSWQRQVIWQVSIMKISVKLILASLLLLTQVFGQEPKKALAQQVASADGKTQTVVTGAAQVPAPAIEPKALPPLNPPLGDIARQARAAHAAAQKAQVVVETDTAQQESQTMVETDTAQQK